MTNTISAQALAAQQAARRSDGTFGTQTHADPGIIDTHGPAAHYVLIETNTERLIYIGPFTDERVAIAALDNSTLVDDLCQEDSTECVTVTDPIIADKDEVISLNDDDLQGTTAAAVVTVMENAPFQAVDLDSYQGWDGTQFSAEIDQVASAIIDFEGDRADSLFVTFPGDIRSDEDWLDNNQSPSIGFVRNGFTICQPLDFETLVNQDDAWGSHPNVRAIATGLLRVRDTMVANFDRTYAER